MKGGVCAQPQPCSWAPPIAGLLKMNVDVGRLWDEGCRWGFVIHSHETDIIMVGNKQGTGFGDAETEEARAYRWGLPQAKVVGHSEIIYRE